jgi:hypothetical protein
MVYDDPMADAREMAAAIRQIARGLQALADAVADESEHPSEAERMLALAREWGEHGLTRVEASKLFRKHGFAPQTAGGWTRGDWIETRDDGLRYLTDRSHEWLVREEVEDSG